MKRNIVIMLVVFFSCGISVAQDVKKDSLTISGTVDKIYSWVLRELNNVQIQGSHPAAQEVRQRWNQVVNHLMNNKSHMAEDVKNLLVSPSGKPIDLDLLKEIIKVNEQDSVKNIELNMDVFFNEIKAASEKVKDAAIKMATKK